jgi:flagellar biosynthesis regulator FlaF
MLLVCRGLASLVVYDVCSLCGVATLSCMLHMLNKYTMRVWCGHLEDLKYTKRVWCGHLEDLKYKKRVWCGHLEDLVPTRLLPSTDPLSSLC